MGTGKKMFFVFSVLLSFLVFAGSARADVFWTDWTSSAAGTIAFPTGNVTVTYTGDLNGGGHDSWVPASTYSTASISAPPDSYGSIALTGGSTSPYSFTFSTPVVNPVMAINSLAGLQQQTYTFTSPFTILVTGTNARNEIGLLTTPDGYTLTSTNGLGASGLIQFTGTFSSITWTPTYEFWQMITVGAPSAVPLPTSMLLFGPGLVGLAAIRRRFKK